MITNEVKKRGELGEIYSPPNFPYMLPEEFGEIPVPLYTPWGQVTRYRKLMSGVFVFEPE